MKLELYSADTSYRKAGEGCITRRSITCTLHILLGWSSQGRWDGQTCSRHVRWEMHTIVLLGNLKRRDDNIRTDLTEIVGRCGLDASGSEKGPVAEVFMTSWVTVSFSRRILLPGVSCMYSINGLYWTIYEWDMSLRRKLRSYGVLRSVDSVQWLKDVVVIRLSYMRNCGLYRVAWNWRCSWFHLNFE
jgi:hypothetical protein